MAQFKNLTANTLTILYGLTTPTAVAPGATVTVSDGVAQSYLTQPGTWQQIGASTTYSASYGDAVAGDATAGSFSVALPPVANAGMVEVVKIDSTANTVTVAPSAADPTTVKINGAATLVVSTQYQAYLLLSNGSQWFIFASTTSTGGALTKAAIIATGLAATDIGAEPVFRAVTAVTRDGSGAVTSVTGTAYTLTSITRAAGLVTGFTINGTAHTVTRNAAGQITGVA